MGEQLTQPTPDESSGTSSIGRRSFIIGSAAAVGGVALPRSVGAFRRDSTVTADPFTLGVASGDPLPRSVILWTRLAPAPTEGGGMPDHAVIVEWEVADDEAMTRIVTRGTAWAKPYHAHSVHVDAQGLQPGREYFYRFRYKQHVSPTGRTRTAPAPTSVPDSLRFGLVSCQRYSSGWYTAYDDLVASDPDLVVHVGDYIYETPRSEVRTDSLPESITLDQYRNRYGLYKQDPSLQAAHAAAPWLFSGDDHEVEDNYAGYIPSVASSTPRVRDFVDRRTAGYKAYWEHMPFRRAAPEGDWYKMRRRVSWGNLADFLVLDTRQYRTDQCGEVGAPCEPSERRQMLGPQQERWLNRRLERSDAAWAVLAQQVIFSKLDFVPGPDEVYNLDQWDGYQLARGRVLDSLQTHRPNDTIVLTGDVHASLVSDLRSDYDDPDASVMGAEFVGPSITSRENSIFRAVLPGTVAATDHLKWGEGSKRGWVQHTVTADEWRADYRHVDDARVVGSPVRTASSWIVPRGGGPTPA